MPLLNRNLRKQHKSMVLTKFEHNQAHLLDRSAPFMEDNVVTKDTKEGVTKILKGLNPFKAW